MSTNDWCRKYDLKLVSTVTAITWEGAPLPLSPAQVEILALLIKGPQPYERLYLKRSMESTRVLVSQMRSALRDIGFPLNISNALGCRDAVLSLQIVADGGDNECNDPAYTGFDRLQNGYRRTA